MTDAGRIVADAEARGREQGWREVVDLVRDESRWLSWSGGFKSKYMRQQIANYLEAQFEEAK